jgi:hypothetical protein
MKLRTKTLTGFRLQLISKSTTLRCRCRWAPNTTGFLSSAFGSFVSMSNVLRGKSGNKIN